jgi:protein O-mannosyl-transferase
MPFQARSVPPEGASLPRASRRTSEWLAASGAAVLSVLLYASTLDNPFVYDDFRLIVENPAIQTLSDIRTVMVRDITRPLVNLTYISDTAVWGTRPFGYHLTNVVLHALNVIAVFWVAFWAAEDWRSKGGGRYGFSPSPRVVAIATSLLVAAHPIMTQAVGYITGRSELLYGLFFLLSWLAARRWMHVGGWWRSATLFLWLLSVLAKETAAMLPVVLWCYDAWLIEDGAGTRMRRIKGLYAPLGLAVLLFGVGRLAVLATLEYPKDVGPNWRYVFVETDVFWQYVALFILPKGQSLVHTVPDFTSLTIRAVAGAIGLAGLVGAAWSLRRIQAVVSLGLVVCVAMLLPSSVLFIMGIGEPMAEHRAYVSAMGFFLALGAASGMAWSRARSFGRGTLVLGASAVVFLAQLAGLTIVRNAIWGDPVALAREATARSPGHWMPRLFLGETLRQNGRCPEAVAEYRAVLDLRTRDTFARKKLLSCLIQTGRIPEAETELHTLRTLEPESPESGLGLGLLAIAQGDTVAGRGYFAEVLAHNPGHQEASQFVALIDGTLPEPHRSRLCGLVRAVAASSEQNASAGSVCR